MLQEEEVLIEGHFYMSILRHSEPQLFAVRDTPRGSVSLWSVRYSLR